MLLKMFNPIVFIDKVTYNQNKKTRIHRDIFAAELPCRARRKRITEYDSILDLQSIPRESNNKDVAAMLVELTIEANEESFVIVHQHGGNDVTCKSRIAESPKHFHWSSIKTLLQH